MWLMPNFWLSQVLLTVPCELITPKHVVSGTLKVLQGHLHFTGDPSSDDSGTGTAASSSQQPRVSMQSVVLSRPLLHLLQACNFACSTHGSSLCPFRRQCSAKCMDDTLIGIAESKCRTEGMLPLMMQQPPVVE